MTFRTKLGINFLCLLLALAASAEEFSGRVVRIVDGDTVVVLDQHRVEQKVRLAGIDAPERGQAFGTRAKEQLAGLVGGKPLNVRWHKEDRYRRLVGKLMLDGQDVNLQMVRSGFAWWFRKYADEQTALDQRLYEAAEKAARSDRVGLWTDPAPMAPWDWRDRPEPPGGYAAKCPCGSGNICIGKRGGRFCVRSSGTKKYFPRQK